MPNADPQTWRAFGDIKDAAGQPLAGAIVELLDKDMLADESLGTARADAQGNWEIRYTPDQCSRDEKDAGDLFIRVSFKHFKGLILGESPVTYNAPPELRIDLTVRALTEFESNRATLDAIRGTRPIEQLTPENIDFCVHETGIARNQVEDMVAAFQRANETSLPPELFYGVFHGLLTANRTLAELAPFSIDKIRIPLEDSMRYQVIAPLPDLERLLKILDFALRPAAPAPAPPAKFTLELFEVRNQTPAQLARTNPELLKAIRTRVLDSIRDSLAKQAERRSVELRYFLKTVDLSPLTEKGEVRAFVTSAMTTLSPSARQEGTSLLNEWQGPTSVDTALPADTKLGDIEALKQDFAISGPDGRRACQSA